MLVFYYEKLNDSLSETFGEVTWKYKIDELINKLHNTLNELINKNDLSIKTTELSKELFETLKTIGNCTSCKDHMEKCNLDRFHRSMNQIENYIDELEKEEGNKKNEIILDLNNNLFEINIRLNKQILCGDCKKETEAI